MDTHSPSVLLSIRPKWCELIASGKKAIELRKTRPRLETPFKVYIYCTKGCFGNLIRVRSEENANLFGYDSIIGINPGFAQNDDIQMCGKIIGEFICDKILPIRVFKNGTIQDYNHFNLQQSCVPYDDIAEYIGKNRTGYGWHISDVVIYDEPKSLSEFEKYSEDGKLPCEKGTHGTYCEYEYFDSYENCRACIIDFDGTHCPKIKVNRPPQSWSYVTLCKPAKPDTQANSEAISCEAENWLIE